MTATTAATKQIVLTREIATPTVLMAWDWLALANLDFLAPLLFLLFLLLLALLPFFLPFLSLNSRLSCPSSLLTSRSLLPVQWWGCIRVVGGNRGCDACLFGRRVRLAFKVCREGNVYDVGLWGACGM